MTDFDEVSRVIGRVEGQLTALAENQNAQWKKLDSIEKTLTSHRLKVAGLSGLISLLVAGAISYFKKGGY